MDEIKEGQIWKIIFSEREPMFIKCFEEHDDKYVFMPVSALVFNVEDYGTEEVTKSNAWKVCQKELIHVEKDKLDFFFARTVLEEDVKLLV